MLISLTNTSKRLSCIVSNRGLLCSYNSLDSEQTMLIASRKKFALIKSLASQENMSMTFAYCVENETKGNRRRNYSKFDDRVGCRG